jgi:hypothetical protein
LLPIFRVFAFFCIVVVEIFFAQEIFHKGVWPSDRRRSRIQEKTKQNNKNGSLLD